MTKCPSERIIACCRDLIYNNIDMDHPQEWFGKYVLIAKHDALLRGDLGFAAQCDELLQAIGEGDEESVIDEIEVMTMEAEEAIGREPD